MKIHVIENILNANDRLAEENYRLLNELGIYALNFMASPGAGKTSLLEQTIQGFASTVRIAVVEGDIASNIDAERAATAGATAVQINTGGNCHLDAVMLHEALKQLPLEDIDLLIVENVGNLICPANFRLGTHRNVLIASVPEGADKPYKYPGIYRGVDALVVNKIDLLPYVSFDMDYFRRGVEILNPGLQTFPVSCVTGEGINDWLGWVQAELAEKRTS